MRFYYLGSTNLYVDANSLTEAKITLRKALGKRFDAHAITTKYPGRDLMSVECLF